MIKFLKDNLLIILEKTTPQVKLILRWLKKAHLIKLIQ